MPPKNSDQISLFRSQIENRRFDGGTLRMLEAVLIARDVRSVVEMRSEIRSLLRSEIGVVLGEIERKVTYEKLLVVDFFVKAFALVGDAESCLALKYEALLLRESKFISDPELRVSYEEWYNFAKDSLDHGFYTIAIKGFESALNCIQSHKNADSCLDTSSVEEHVVDNILQLRETAEALAASHSVQTESANYLKRKAVVEESNHPSFSDNRNQNASLMYRSGIRKRNMLKLQKSQSLLPNANGS